MRSTRAGLVPSFLPQSDATLAACSASLAHALQEPWRARVGSAPEEYSGLGKGVRSEVSYLDNQDDPQRKLIGNRNGALPQAQIRGVFFVDHLSHLEIFTILCLKPLKKCYTVWEHDPIVASRFHFRARLGWTINRRVSKTAR